MREYYEPGPVQTVQEFANAHNTVQTFVEAVRVKDTRSEGGLAVSPAALLVLGEDTVDNVSQAVSRLNQPFSFRLPMEGQAAEPMAWKPTARIDRRFKGARRSVIGARDGVAPLRGTCAASIVKLDDMPTTQIVAMLTQARMVPATIAETDTFVAAFIQAGGSLKGVTLIALGERVSYRHNPNGEEVHGYARFSDGDDVQLFEESGTLWSTAMVLALHVG